MLMRKVLVTAAVVAFALPVLAGEGRTIEGTVAAGELEKVVLETGVGDVEVVAVAGDVVRYQVELKPRRGGLFSSLKQAEREVREATVRAETVGRALELKIDSESGERRFEERWTVELPARLAIELDLGVGDLEIRSLEGAVDVESGVGDILIADCRGSVSLESGVGDVVVSGKTADFGTVECSTGVGDARIRVDGRTISGDGFVGHSAEWTGSGPSSLSVELGVGDARITLE